MTQIMTQTHFLKPRLKHIKNNTSLRNNTRNVKSTPEMTQKKH